MLDVTQEAGWDPLWMRHLLGLVPQHLLATTGRSR
jgi:hypothetical protein